MAPSYLSHMYRKTSFPNLFIPNSLEATSVTRGRKKLARLSVNLIEYNWLESRSSYFAAKRFSMILPVDFRGFRLAFVPLWPDVALRMTIR